MRRAVTSLPDCAATPSPGAAAVVERLAAVLNSKVPENLLEPLNELRPDEDFLPRAVTSLDVGSFVDQEIEQRDGSVSVREHGGEDAGSVPLKEFTNRLAGELYSAPLTPRKSSHSHA